MGAAHSSETLIIFLLGYLVHVSEYYNFQETSAPFQQHVFYSLLECGCLNLILSLLSVNTVVISRWCSWLLYVNVIKVITKTGMSLSNITSETPSVNEKFNLVSPPLFPSTILLKVDAYRFIACNVNQCASCSKCSVFRWQCCYGSLLKQNVAVSRGSLMGDILLCLQYVIFLQRQWVQHSLIYWYNKNF